MVYRYINYLIIKLFKIDFHNFHYQTEFLNYFFKI